MITRRSLFAAIGWLFGLKPTKAAVPFEERPVEIHLRRDTVRELETLTGRKVLADHCRYPMTYRYDKKTGQFFAEPDQQERIRAVREYFKKVGVIG